MYNKLANLYKPPSIADQRKGPKRHVQWNSTHYTRQLQRDFLPARALNVCDAAVVVRPILYCYLHVIYNETYVIVTQFLKFRPWRIFLSVTGEQVFAICDSCNKKCPQ